MYQLTLVSRVVPSMAEVAEEDNDEEDAHDDADDDDDPEFELGQTSCQHRFWQKKKNDFLVDLFFEKWAYDPKKHKGK